MRYLARLLGKPVLFQAFNGEILLFYRLWDKDYEFNYEIEYETSYDL